MLILITYDVDEYVFAALRAGACGLLLKHTSPEGLVEAVRTWNTQTIAPKVAPRLSRFSTIALTGTTTEPVKRNSSPRWPARPPRGPGQPPEQGVLVVDRRGAVPGDLHREPAGCVARAREPGRNLCGGSKLVGVGAGSRPGRPPGWRPRSPAAAAVLVVAAALALAGCRSGPDRRYTAEPARPADVVERVSAPGSVQAAGQADLKAPTAARVESLAVKDGQRVREGQLVARLASDQADQQLRQAEAAAAQANSLGGAVPTLPTGAALEAFQQVQSQVTATSAAVIAALRSALPLLPERQRRRLQARIDAAQARLVELERQADRAAGQAAAAADAQSAALRRSVEAATAAQRGQAQLAVELARDQRRRLTLRAPLAGTVQLGRVSTGGSGGGSGGVPSVPSLPEGAQQALQGLAGGGGGQAGPTLRAGSEVSAGQTVATVFDVGDLLVAAEVDETDVALVRPGQRAQVELDAFPEAAFAATVRRVAVAPSGGQSAAGGVTYQVDLALGDVVRPGSRGGRPAPRVGMTATAEIEVRRAAGRLSVPGSALVGRAGGQAVFVVQGGKVHLRRIQVAADGEDRVAVASGLRDGEQVVSRGAERLRDGQDWPGPGG